MHNLNDDELDRLSREAAEQQEAPAYTSAWEKISARLDREMPQKPGINYHIIPDLALLLILLIGIPLAMKSPGKLNAIAIYDMSETEAPAPLKSAAETKPPVSATRENYILPVTEENDKKTKDGTKEQINSGDARTGSLTWKKKSDFLLELNGNSSCNKVQTNRTTAGGDKIGYGIKGGGKETGEVDFGISMDGDKTAAQQNRTPESLQQNDNPGALHDKLVLTEQSSLVLPASVQQMLEESRRKDSADRIALAEKKRKKMDEMNQSTNLLELGLVWSPDVSKVGTASAEHVGSTYGITAGFNFNKRWSIQTGFLYSNKYYTSTGDGYQKIPGYNPYDPYIKVTKVQAECFMWDIPLNVRYNWLYRPSQRAFVSTGLSSYFMKKEDLHYWYKYYNNPRYKHWENNAESNYWFSVLNLSAGFEQRIFEGFTVQAEPFFKVSLSDIGYGKINLRSYGIFLGLKYIPPLHRSKK